MLRKKFLTLDRNILRPRIQNRPEDTVTRLIFLPCNGIKTIQFHLQVKEMNRRQLQTFPTTRIYDDPFLPSSPRGDPETVMVVGPFLGSPRSNVKGCTGGDCGTYPPEMTTIHHLQVQRWCRSSSRRMIFHPHLPNRGVQQRRLQCPKSRRNRGPLLFSGSKGESEETIVGPHPPHPSTSVFTPCSHIHSVFTPRNNIRPFAPFTSEK